MKPLNPLCIKEMSSDHLSLHLSLHPSRHLSHDQSSDIKNRIGGIEEDNGRVMGEIKIISPVLDSLCLKGFQKKKGGMRDYSKNLCFLNLTAQVLRPTPFVLNLNTL